MCDVEIVAAEPSDASPQPPASLSPAAAARLKMARAKKALADSTASLAALASQPFPYEEIKDDDGRTYFYNEASDEALWELPPEHAAIHFEKKRLLKVKLSAQKDLESTAAILDKLPADEAVGEPVGTAGKSAPDGNVKDKPLAKLPLPAGWSAFFNDGEREDLKRGWWYAVGVSAAA